MAKAFSSRRSLLILIVILLLSLVTWFGLVGFALSDEPDLPEMPVLEIDLDQFPGFPEDAPSIDGRIM